jgi:hypothetical protein
VAQVKYAWQQQADAALSQVNPVSGVGYTVLAPTEDVRIISIAGQITWAVTQPTPLAATVNIDGQTIVHWVFNPVSATVYHADTNMFNIEANQAMLTTPNQRAFLYEGHLVDVTARVNWAVTQPTPLELRVKWARLLPT